MFQICVLQNGVKSLVTACERGGKDSSLQDESGLSAAGKWWSIRMLFLPLAPVWRWSGFWPDPRVGGRGTS